MTYIRWESGGLYEFFINPNRFGWYTQADMAKKVGVSRQYVNSRKDEYEKMRMFSREYLKEIKQ